MSLLSSNFFNSFKTFIFSSSKNSFISEELKLFILTSIFLSLNKYNFSKKKNSFYGKAGISTYLMTKENNNYNAVVSGQQQNINSTYTNTHCYTAATVNIGAGYQFGITKKLKIGIEPYLQIPLKGIGIGYMPVTSTGIQLVLTHK